MRKLAKGIDCASPLTTASAKALFTKGITHVGRYLGNSWKGLTKEEVQAIKEADLQIFSIFETNPTERSYFTSSQGKADARTAEEFAKNLGQPKGSVIYFTVDYDALSGDFDEILAYFKAVVSESNYYKVGVYGSYYVVTFLHDKKLVDYFFQTYGWSDGKQASYAHIYQYQIDTTLAGISVDLDEMKKEDVGAWGEKAAPVKTALTQPAVQPKKEEEKLYQPSNQSIKDATRIVITRLSDKDPNGIDKSWIKKLDDGTLTESDAIGLIYVALERGLIQGPK